MTVSGDRYGAIMMSQRFSPISRSTIPKLFTHSLCCTGRWHNWRTSRRPRFGRHCRTRTTPPPRNGSWSRSRTNRASHRRSWPTGTASPARPFITGCNDSRRNPSGTRPATSLVPVGRRSSGGEERDELLRLLRNSPKAAGYDAEEWNIPLVQRLVAEQFDVAYSRTSAYRILSSVSN